MFGQRDESGTQSKEALSRRGVLCGLGALAVASVVPMRSARAFERTGMVDVKQGRLEYSVRGHGPTIYMIPSFGRGCEDFDALSHSLVRGGYRVVCAQPRGAGSSRSEMNKLSLADMADDAAAVLKVVGGTPAVLVGHDFGQRVTRTLATKRPDLVRSLVMFACGGKIKMRPQVLQAGQLCFDLALPWEVRKAAVRYAFFAPGNDPTPWRHGWYPEAAKLQMGAIEDPVSAYWAGGGVVKALVVQGLQDVAAVPENAHIFKADFPHRVELVEVNHAAHALLPEQPGRVADAVLKFLHANA